MLTRVRFQPRAENGAVGAGDRQGSRAGTSDGLGLYLPASVLLERKERGAVGLLRTLAPDGTVGGMRGINDGVGLVFVSHTGDICPSGFLPVPQGNVRTHDLAEVYRNGPLFRAARDTGALEGKCGACPFKVVCGGSRARAFALGGSVYASDPLCPYVPKGWPAS
jgi:radical SAM protein with 4Fe4S-binding SPASM domain